MLLLDLETAVIELCPLNRPLFSSHQSRSPPQVPFAAIAFLDRGIFLQENDVVDIDPVLTIPELAEDLRVSKSHAAKLLRGEVEGVKPIPHLSAGRRKLVPRSALERWKRENLSGMLSDHSEKNTTVTHFQRRS
jgi:hypothetical protein